MPYISNNTFLMSTFIHHPQFTAKVAETLINTTSNYDTFCQGLKYLNYSTAKQKHWLEQLIARQKQDKDDFNNKTPEQN